MDVHYLPERTTSLQRISERIGATPQKRDLLNYNYVTTAAVLAAGWNYTLLNGLVPGTGASNRIGREIYLDYIQWYVSQTALRWMFVYDKQPNGVTPASNALTEDSTDQRSPHNFSNRERFDILWDSQFDTTPEQAPIVQRKAFPVCRTTYYNSGSAGTVADITTGALYLAIWSAGAGAAPSFALNLYYKE